MTKLCGKTTKHTRHLWSEPVCMGALSHWCSGKASLSLLDQLTVDLMMIEANHP